MNQSFCLFSCILQAISFHLGVFFGSFVCLFVCFSPELSQYLAFSYSLTFRKVLSLDLIPSNSLFL